MNTDYLEYLGRAKEFVAAAELCSANGLHNAAASRAYYGALHAAVAALVCYCGDLKAVNLL